MATAGPNAKIQIVRGFDVPLTIRVLQGPGDLGGLGFRGIGFREGFDMRGTWRPGVVGFSLQQLGPQSISALGF